VLCTVDAGGVTVGGAAGAADASVIAAKEQDEKKQARRLNGICGILT
jgi:hypothetical protein